MIPHSRIEATMRFLNLDRMQAINHENARDEVRAILRRERCRRVRFQTQEGL